MIFCVSYVKAFRKGIVWMASAMFSPGISIASGNLVSEDDDIDDT